MKQLYIVVESDSVRYVSTDSENIIDQVAVNVIYIDSNGDSQTSPETIAIADSLVKIW